MEKKNVNSVLDIHTHKSATASGGRSIINYQLLSDSPLYMPHVNSVETAVDRGLYRRKLADVLEEGESILDLLLVNSLSPCEGYFYSAGIHPWELSERNAERQLEFLKEQVAEKLFVAVGEAGLDKLAMAPMELQMEMFREQVELSEEYKLPLIIHCVKAMDELLAVKKEYRPVQPWIWHGFRGTPQQAEQLLRKGFYLSFGEYYPDETITVVPANRLFLETDNSPLDIEEVLHRAAQVRGVDVEVLRASVHKNIQKVFFSA